MHCFILFSYSDLDIFLCKNGGESNKGSVRGSTRLKPPTLARPHSDHSHELFHDRRSSEERELISPHQPQEFGKGQKETPHVRPPPRILSGLHVG